MTINHATVLPKVAGYLSKDEGVFYSIRDLFDLVPFDEEDNVTLQGLCFTLGNIVVGDCKRDPYYEGLENLYKLILYTSGSNCKSYVAFEKDSKRKTRDFLGRLHDQGSLYKKKKFKIHENEETKEVGIFV